MQLFEVFFRVIKLQQITLGTRYRRYMNGIYKLEEANTSVDIMQGELQQMKPKYNFAKSETERILIELNKDRQVNYI